MYEKISAGLTVRGSAGLDQVPTTRGTSEAAAPARINPLSIDERLPYGPHGSYSKTLRAGSGVATIRDVGERSAAQALPADSGGEVAPTRP
jgi:hypothetical protein